MVSVVHVYNRWSKSEIRCYVDGQMVSGTDMSWLVSSSDVSTVKLQSFGYHFSQVETLLILFHGVMPFLAHLSR